MGIRKIQKGNLCHTYSAKVYSSNRLMLHSGDLTFCTAGGS